MSLSARLKLAVAVYLVAVALWLQMKWLRTANTARKVMGNSTTQQLRRILARCPSVDRPHYLPPIWASNKWVNLVLFIVKAGFIQRFVFRFPLIHEALTAPDGAIISLDWSDDTATRALPADAPILLLLHTISGKGDESTYFLRQAIKEGFRGVVLNRRGHAEPLQTAGFNVLGDVDDCRQQVALVRERYPEAWLGMAGVSMGSALCVNYLGQEGEQTPVRAGCVLCPAYDLETAFGHLAQGLPLVDAHVMGSLKSLWLNKLNGNYDMLAATDPEAAKACESAPNIDGFIRASVPFTGATSYEDFMAKFNPVEWCTGIARPVLVLNAEDDMISLPCNIREELADDVPSAVLVRTTYGTHIAYSEGCVYCCLLTILLVCLFVCVCVCVCAGARRLFVKLTCRPQLDDFFTGGLGKEITCAD